MDCNQIYRVARDRGMFLVLVGLLFFSNLIYGELLMSEVCGGNHVVYSKANENEVFQINGLHVPRYLFCDFVMQTCGSIRPLGTSI